MKHPVAKYAVGGVFGFGKPKTQTQFWMLSDSAGLSLAANVVIANHVQSLALLSRDDDVLSIVCCDTVRVVRYVWSGDNQEGPLPKTLWSATSIARLPDISSDWLDTIVQAMMDHDAETRYLAHVYFQDIDHVVLISVNRAMQGAPSDGIFITNRGVAAAMEACCSYCMKEGVSLKCSRCNLCRYCDRECQMRDWPMHKQTCGCFTKSIMRQAIDDAGARQTMDDGFGASGCTFRRSSNTWST